MGIKEDDSHKCYRKDCHYRNAFSCWQLKPHQGRQWQNEDVNIQCYNERRLCLPVGQRNKCTAIEGVKPSLAYMRGLVVSRDGSSRPIDQEIQCKTNPDSDAHGPVYSEEL